MWVSGGSGADWNIEMDALKQQMMTYTSSSSTPEVVTPNAQLLAWKRSMLTRYVDVDWQASLRTED